jgi:putative DNA primase/helicase
VNGEELPAPSNPMAVARQILPDWQNEDGHLVCRRWRGSWMRWRGTRWHEIDEAQIRKAMYERLEHARFPVPGRGDQTEYREWAPTKPKISNLLDALGSITLLPSDVDAPAWFDSGGADTDGWGPIVACANGLLRIRDRQLVPHTPGFFNHVSVPFPYDPDARAPEWESFLAKIWPDAPEAVAALQEWFGYVLSGRTDQQKILLMVRTVPLRQGHHRPRHEGAGRQEQPGRPDPRGARHELRARHAHREAARRDLRRAAVRQRQQSGRRAAADHLRRGHHRHRP